MLDDSVIAKHIIQKKSENKALIDDFIKLQKSKLHSKISNHISFNNDEIYEVSIDGNSNMIVANQMGYDIANVENYGIGAAIMENGISDLLIVKTAKKSDSVFRIEYFNSNFELLSTIQLDSRNQSIETYDNYTQKNIDLAAKGCGQKTSDCLVDAYSNHGWVSVWAFVQTAFIPATALALTAACALNECIK